ncbi:LOW QUALITY PROTEIN: olfactory receptor 1F1 [Glossophaga mutica]
MRGANQSSVSELLLQGLSSQQSLFVFFLSMYLAMVLGNLFILLAIRMDKGLHTPMYFLLSNLSLVDICFSSNAIPKNLANHILESQTIFSECLTMYLLFELVNMDHFLLAVMACVLCHLHYSAKMIQQLCALLVTGLWVIASLNALLHTLLMVLPFCADNVILFFYDATPFLEHSCSDTHLNKMMALTERALIVITPFVCTLPLYIHFTCAALRVPSKKGRWKAFSICASHLAVVFLFSSIIIAVYFNPSSLHSSEDTKATVIYILVILMMNPFIYSLRNRDLKGALQKITGRKACSY